jgi:NAD(P)-dependent dehydrogenase (short-subunit alcohol dehydrogenase family)
MTSSQPTHNPEVLVIIGAGGMGLAIARRIGARRVFCLAGVNSALRDTASGVLAGDGNTILTGHVDVTSRGVPERAHRSHRLGSGLAGRRPKRNAPSAASLSP